MQKEIKDSFPFTIWSGLFQNGHRQKMGSAVWEFLWCIDKITKEIRQSENALPIGLVLGGKPIKAEEIAKSLHTHPETVKKNLRRLKKEKYIDYKLAPYGYIITVNNSKKFRCSKNALPQQQNALPQQQNALPQQQNALPNKTYNRHTLDITVDKKKGSEFEHLKNNTFLSTFNDYLTMRQKIRRPATERAKELALKELHKYDLKTATAMLEQSIFNSWQGIFPLKRKEQKDGKDKRYIPESLRENQEQRRRDLERGTKEIT